MRRVRQVPRRVRARGRRAATAFRRCATQRVSTRATAATLGRCRLRACGEHRDCLKAWDRGAPRVKLVQWRPFRAASISCDHPQACGPAAGAVLAVFLTSVWRESKIMGCVARVAELVDAHGSGPCAARCGGSSPFPGTTVTSQQSRETPRPQRVKRTARLTKSVQCGFFCLRFARASAASDGVDGRQQRSHLRPSFLVPLLWRSPPPLRDLVDRRNVRWESHAPISEPHRRSMFVE